MDEEVYGQGIGIVYSTKSRQQMAVLRHVVRWVQLTENQARY
jgi:hypothetical protein